MTNLLVLVVSCDKNKNLWDSILKKEIDNLIIVCGAKLTNDFTLDDNILYVNCHDSYDALPEKMICAYNAIANINKFRDITHVIKIDDHDTIFTKETIERLTKHGTQLLLKNHYIGQHVYSRCVGSYHIGRCPGSKWNTRLYEGDNCAYIAGGFSYILDRFAIDKIIKEYSIHNLNLIREKHIYEDLMIALILKKHGIYPIKAYYGIGSTDPLYRDRVPISIRNAFYNLPI